MSAAVSITRLIDVARRLRTAADEIGNVELKSQIVDEISTLQEIRETLSSDHETEPRPVQAASLEATSVPQDSSESLEHRIPEPKDEHGGVEDSKDFQTKMNRLEPTGDGEGYGILADAPEDEEALADDESDCSATEREKTVDPENASAKTDKKTRSTGNQELSADERAVIEMHIAELEPLKQSALRRMNDLFTPEQKKIKAQATKAGRKAGKTGRELQHHVYSAIRMSPEQKEQFLVARKDFESVREAIRKQEALLGKSTAADSDTLHD